MATQLWNKEITKSVDWGGDTSTGGAPVSGQFVQKFIKDQLAKKFGYLNYDRNNKKYQVFADEEDYNTWKSDSATNANLLLATFDAPAPATIKLTAVSKQNVTVLSTEKNQQIVINYSIKDSSDNLMAEGISLRMAVVNGGLTQTFTTSYDPDYDGYNKLDANQQPVGTTKTLDIDEYLTLGTNNITITLTGASSQAQSTLSFKYTIVELNLESNFDNSVAQVYDRKKSSDELFDIQLGNVITIPYTCSGQGGKYIEIFVNGQEFKQTGIKDAVSSGSFITNDSDYRSSLFLFMSDNKGNLREPFKDGVNSLQFRIYVANSEGGKIYSRTLYYDIVIRDVEDNLDKVFILYKQSFNNEDYVFGANDTEEEKENLKFETQQYSNASFEYSVYSSTGKQVPLLFTLLNTENNLVVATQQRTLNSGDVDTFNYTFMTYGKINIIIETQLKSADGALIKDVYDIKTVEVSVKKSDVQIEVLKGQDLLLNLEALNRSNSEPEELRNTWVDADHPRIKTHFNNVYFNEASGWDGEALLLNNGATLEIDYNVWGTNKDVLDANGLTFEITFEMVNVQDEEAVMLSFKDENPTNKSCIELTASQAKLADMSGNFVYTKYNSNTKIKLAFVVNPADDTFTGSEDGTYSPYANFIIINGILDKANKYSGELIWDNVNDHKIVIGDVNGKAGIRVFSLRVYNKALSLDEELTNWIAESGDILKNYKSNAIYGEDQQPALSILREKIPTLILYGDVDATRPWTVSDKKNNLQMDMLFHDPGDPERDFYARGCWVSPQGTSSMSYPIKNLRPYFGKAADKKSKDNGEYWTEVYLAGEFDAEKRDFSEDKLGHFYTNKKVTVFTNADGDKEYYHKCYNNDQAEKLEKEGEQIFYKTIVDGQTVYIPCSLGNNPANMYSKDQAEQKKDYPDDAKYFYVYGVREVKPFRFTSTFQGGGIKKEDSDYIDMYWKLLKELRLSGQTLYKLSKTKDVENPDSKVNYPVNVFTKVKGTEELKKTTTYYLIQGEWKQYEKSGWTDRWTLKADYAESSMCNNAGTGRLWGDAMKGFRINGEYLGMTNAQKAMHELGNDMVDIRTSCDGKPIVMFQAKPLKDEQGNYIIKNGLRQYDVPKYSGLYNIMTDKSSTPLFGFENIYNEKGTLIYDAADVTCFECLSNVVDFSMGLDVSCDRDSISNADMDYRKPLWNAYESRWPDCKGPKGEAVAHTNRLESLWRFINFCKPAVNYTIGGADGYGTSEWMKIAKEEDLQKQYNKAERPKFARGAMVSGNMKYTEISDPGDNTFYNALVTAMNAGALYYFNTEYDYKNAKKELSGAVIEGHIYKGRAASFDAKHGVFLEDIQFDVERVNDKANGLSFNDPINGSPVMEDYYVDVYLNSVGSQYQYVDEYGNRVTYKGSVDRDDYERDDKGKSYAGRTYMEYFSDKKYEWFNVWRLAAYYVYLMRFAAVDQVVKNSMLTTEDGKHYYYINYDNDTILGVRNDGNLVYHWNINRDSYDEEVNGFCFAGNKSVLWNLLECDADFMDKVKQVDNAMFASGVLSSKIALQMYNEKQEGSWGERMYNINEQRKYLSQWGGKSAEATYLQFIHGSSNQYRSWFLTNRFNFYDSLWETGDYTTTKIGFRMDIDKTDKKSPMLRITAARQNKFKLSNSDGNLKDVDVWKKELEQDEMAEWIAIENVKGMSSPWQLFGCDKIKVLDFRPSVGMPNFELQEVMFKDGVNWQEEKGCLMTGFLIGTSDEYLEKAVYRYKIKADKDVASVNLLTTTINATTTYTTSDKLNLTDAELEALNVVMNVEDNKYVYSVKPGTTRDVILPTVVLRGHDDKYDRESPLGTYDVENVEVTLVPKTTCLVRAIGSINSIYSLEEIDLRNCYNPAGLLNDTIILDNLNNLHIFRAIGSSITSFKPAKGCSLNEVSLPAGRIKSLSLDSVSFTPIYDDEGNMIPQFKYTPDSTLRNLELINIVMNGDDDTKAFDIKQFIDSWIDAYIADYGETNAQGENQLKNLSLTLDGISFERKHFVSFDWLVKLKKLNIISLTGDIYVLGNEEGEPLSQEQFEKLDKMFERPFESTSSLRLTTDDSTFWTISGEKCYPEDGKEYVVWNDNQNLVYNWYEVLHEESLTFKATKFSSDPNADLSQNYSFDYLNGQGRWVQANRSGNIRYASTTNSGSVYKFVLTVNQIGDSVFKSYIHSATGVESIDKLNLTGSNDIRQIRIYPIRSIGNSVERAGDYIFVQIKKIVEPENVLIYCDDSKTPLSTVGNDNTHFVVDFDEHLKYHKFTIKYSNEDEITVNSIKPIISLAENKNADTKISNKWGIVDKDSIKVLSNRKHGSEFEFAPMLQPADASKDIYITVPFYTGLETTGEKSKEIILTVNTKTIVPTEIFITIPDEFNSGNYAGSVYTSECTITRTVDDGAGNITEIPYGKSIKLSINRVIPREGLNFPIKTKAMVGTGVNKVEKTPNVPIRKFNDVMGNVNFLDKINKPTVIKDENGNWFVHIEPTNRNSWKESFNAEYDVFLSGEYGYTGYDWDNINVNDKQWVIDYGWRLDASIIWPNDIDVIVNYGSPGAYSIKSNNLVINASDGDEKTFTLTIVPIDKTQSDPVTVPVSFDEPIIDMYANADSEDIIHPNKSDVDSWIDNNMVEADKPSQNYDNFVSYTFEVPSMPSPTNPNCYPEIELTLHKYSDGDGTLDKIIYLRPLIKLKCNSLSISDTNYTASVSTEFSFGVEQTLSSTNRIDDCVPYDIPGMADKCEWYFVDSSNYYYKFDFDILQQIKTSGKLNSLIGIAKRIQYGWGEEMEYEYEVEGITKTGRGLVNAEQNGNLLNNACNIWNFDPNINITTANSSNGTFKNSYYKALCIPLANWRVDEGMLNPSTNGLVTASGGNGLWNGSGDWKGAKYLNEQYGSWAIPRTPMFMVNSDSVTTPDNDGNGNAKPNVFKQLQSQLDTISLSTQWKCSALHTKTDITGKQENIRNRSTNKVLDKNNPSLGSVDNQPRRKSMWDMATATKYLCTGKLPSWFGTNVESKIPQSATIDSLTREQAIWPRYGNGAKFTSGIADVWHHFNIYNNAIVDMTGSKPNDLQRYNCYPASLFEIECLFNGKQYNKGNIYIAMINNAGSIFNGTSLSEFDADSFNLNKDMKNVEASTSDADHKPIPYGIYEIVNALAKSKCLYKNNNKYEGPLAITVGDKTSHNVFVNYLYDYFFNGEHTKTYNTGDSGFTPQIQFGSLYYMRYLGQTEDSYNLIQWTKGSNNTKEVFGLVEHAKTKSEDTAPEKTTTTIGTQNHIIMIPLLMVD